MRRWTLWTNVAMCLAGSEKWAREFSVQSALEKILKAGVVDMFISYAASKSKMVLCVKANIVWNIAYVSGEKSFALHLFFDFFFSPDRTKLVEDNWRNWIKFFLSTRGSVQNEWCNLHLDVFMLKGTMLHAKPRYAHSSFSHDKYVQF